jgi:predicted GNAT family acetyltransferase
MSDMQIQRIEELSVNALPALQTVVYDGWVLRFSNGYTKRANSISPLYPTHMNLAEKIRKCEELYLKRNQKVVYKMTSASNPYKLDHTLENEGYLKKELVSVRLFELNDIEPPTIHSIEIDGTISMEWLYNFCNLNGVKEENKPILHQMLQNIVPTTCFISLKQDNKVISCGLGVLEGEYIGLFDIVTDQNFRNQGFAKQLILNLLQWAKENGAKTAYLQVVLDNRPALNLYSKLGFEELYQYWYRIKELR